MIITVKVSDVEISIEENHGSAEKHITMRWSDQNKQIQETIKVMSAECLKLLAVSKSETHTANVDVKVSES